MINTYSFIDQWTTVAVYEDNHNRETFLVTQCANGHESRKNKPEKRHDAQPWTKDARYKYNRKK